ncbi:MAG: YceI family protein [Winogradskyella sp.]|uniref:YceI family protein n=1 Tax=Winogradskyella sp. TaxID=1883156 RepID=UPI000F3E9E46|nr:YceI family protein [Winogradskyella sp.]RNC85024.1 MAG: YceI family protein [Winogradskyella sp.]
MKNLKHLAIVILAMSFFSFTVFTEKQINIEESTIEWTGKKVTGQHVGTINFESGMLAFDGDNLVGGEFVIDMTTITVTDLTGKGKANLEGHLKSDDFFGVAAHNTATLKITNVSKHKKDYEVIGNLTIKGITKPINFTLVMEANSASAKVTVNRAEFDVRYGSPSFFNNLKDKAIYDNFDLDVKLSF